MLNNQVLYDRKIAVRMDRADPKSDLPAKLPEGLRGIGMGLGAGGAPLQNVASVYYKFFILLIKLLNNFDQLNICLELINVG